MNYLRTHPLLPAHGLMLLTMLLVSSSFPVGAAIAKALDPAILMFFRFALAAVFFAPYVFIKNSLTLPSKTQLSRYAILSMPLVAFFWCMFESLRYTSALNTGALFTTIPGITSICAFFINREKTGKMRALGLLIGTIGALWIIFRGDWEALIGLQFNKGDVIFLIGCFFMGLYNPLIKYFYHDEPVEVMTFWTLLAGSIWLLALSGKSFWMTQWQEVEMGVYMGILYLALFTTLCTFFLLQFCTIKLGSTKVSAYSLLNPVAVIFISVVFGISDFEWITLPGMLTVILSMLIVQSSHNDIPTK